MQRPSALPASNPIRPFKQQSSSKADLETQLVEELSGEKRGEKASQMKDSSKVPEGPDANNPAAQLVSELFESLKNKSGA